MLAEVRAYRLRAGLTQAGGSQANQCVPAPGVQDYLAAVGGDLVIEYETGDARVRVA